MHGCRISDPGRYRGIPAIWDACALSCFRARGWLHGYRSQTRRRTQEDRVYGKRDGTLALAHRLR